MKVVCSGIPMPQLARLSQPYLSPSIARVVMCVCELWRPLAKATKKYISIHGARRKKLLKPFRYVMHIRGVWFSSIGGSIRLVARLAQPLGQHAFDTVDSSMCVCVCCVYKRWEAWTCIRICAMCVALTTPTRPRTHCERFEVNEMNFLNLRCFFFIWTVCVLWGFFLWHIRTCTIVVYA